MLHIGRAHSVAVVARRVLFGTAIGLLASACRDGIANPFASEGRLSAITVSGDTIVQVGDTARFSAVGSVSGVVGLLTYDRLLDAAWSVSDSTIVRITPLVPPRTDSTSTAAVLVTGLRSGNVQLTATARGVHGSTAVHVVAAP